MVHLTMRARQGSDWIALDREFDAWAEAGHSATLWWRDDDAVSSTAELERLLALADGVPLALAVIPAAAQSFPADVTVVQHGWAHEDNAPAGARKCELAHPSILERLREGKARLERLFGPRFLPVMVPPWNRIAPDVAAALPALGYLGMSVIGARRTSFERNVHVDLIDWRRRSFAGETEVLEALRRHLSARRRGEVGRNEATGIMTHHLVHGAATERFLARLVEATRAHPAVRWLEPRDVFARP